MAFGKKINMKGLRVQTDRRDSKSYLLSPELSRSPTQFSVSPSYSYVEEFGSPNKRDNRNKFVGHTWQTSSAGFMAPMLPARPPCVGTWNQNFSPQNNNFHGKLDEV